MDLDTTIVSVAAIVAVVLLATLYVVAVLFVDR